MADIPDALVDKVATAIRASRAKDDEGEFECLGDLLGFSGENKTLTVSRCAARSALAASKWLEMKDALVDLGKATKASLELADTKLVEIIEQFKANGLDVTEARSPEAQAAYDACKSALDKARSALQVTG